MYEPGNHKFLLLFLCIICCGVCLPSVSWGSSRPKNSSVCGDLGVFLMLWGGGAIKSPPFFFWQDLAPVAYVVSLVWICMSFGVMNIHEN